MNQYALIAVGVVVAAAVAVVSFVAGFISGNTFAKSGNDDGGEIMRRCDDCGAKWPPEEWPPDDQETCEECGSDDIRTWYRVS